MQVVEVSGRIDKHGRLKISPDFSLPLTAGDVKVIIMYNDESEEKL